MRSLFDEPITDDSELPVELSLEALDQSILLTRFLGERPGCRVTYSGRLADQPVVIKLFGRSSAAQDDFDQEIFRLTELRACRLDVPPVVHLRLTGTGESCVVTAFLEQSLNLGQFSQYQLPEEFESEKVGHALGGYLRNMHNAGFILKDTRLSDFVYSGGRIWLVGGSIGRVAHFRSTRQTLKGLAELLAQLPVNAGDIAMQIISGYGEQFSADQVLRMMIRSRSVRERVYLKKTLGSGGEFVAQKTDDGTRVLRRELLGDASFEALLADLDGAMVRGESLKQGNSATLAKVELSGRIIVVKRYNVKSWWHRLRLTMRVSRAIRSWQNGYRLRMWGLSTPLPLAVIEQQRGPLSGRAYLICDYSETTDCSWYWQHHQESWSLRNRLANTIGSLQALGLSHGDMKANNIKFNGERVELLDLDSLRRWKSKVGHGRAIAADVRRLVANWADTPAYAKQLGSDIAAALAKQLAQPGFTER